MEKEERFLKVHELKFDYELGWVKVKYTIEGDWDDETTFNDEIIRAESGYFDEVLWQELGRQALQEIDKIRKAEGINDIHVGD